MKHLLFLLMLAFTIRSAEASDSSSEGPAISEKERNLLEALKESEETIATLTRANGMEATDPNQIDGKAEHNNVQEEGTDKILARLTAQVESLRNKSIVEKATNSTLQNPQRVRVKGSKTVFNYKPDSVYEITISPDHITDLQLEPGELITSPPTAGDTVRWNIGVMKSGQGPSEITHLILKALDNDIETNLVVTTNSRTYQLRLRSSDWHMPVVAWNYPKDQTAAIAAAMKKEQIVEHTVDPDKLNFDYEIDDADYPWTPVRVFDDGEKTFIQMPKSMRVNEAPALFLLEEDSDPLLINYRVAGAYYIIDRLIERAELRVGPRRKVEIQAGKFRKSFFERLFD